MNDQLQTRKTRQILWSLFVGALIGLTLMGIAILRSPESHASPALGCESIHWGFLGSQRRLICDTPRNPDGSWMRYRVVMTPAHYVPFNTYCSRYSCSSSGGYYVDDTVQAKENYIVTDATVLPDEPGWLPTGSEVIR